MFHIIIFNCFLKNTQSQQKLTFSRKTMTKQPQKEEAEEKGEQEEKEEEELDNGWT